MAQEPSHGSQQEKEQHKEEGTASTSSSNNNNKHESQSWLQLGLAPPPTSSAQEEPDQRNITELQLFTNPQSQVEQETSRQTTHIVPPVQMQRQFPFFPGSSSYSGDPGPSTSSAPADRVVILPPRPQTGVWFVLRASQNQRREPWLPQIGRRFLRIRDANMTISTVMKYVVNKLGLQHESEVEFTCRGQRLHPAMTLRYVRDTIWCSSEAGPSILSPSSTTDLLMTLEYGRTA